MGKRHILWSMLAVLICVLISMYVLLMKETESPGIENIPDSTLKAPKDEITDDTGEASTSPDTLKTERIEPQKKTARSEESPKAVKSRDPSKAALSGTITVKDEFGGLHTSESGSFDFILWSGTSGLHKAVEVVEGEWSTEVPPDVELGVTDVRLGGRVGVFDAEKKRMPIPDNGFLSLEVRWPPETRLRVLAADMGADLRNIELVSGLGFKKKWDNHPGAYTHRNIIFEDASSPITLGKTNKELHSIGYGKKTYFARSPGYAWGPVRVDVHRGGEYILKLHPCGELGVSVVGLDPGARPVLRLRRASEETSFEIAENLPESVRDQLPVSVLDELAKSIPEDPYAGWDHSPAFEQILTSDRPMVVDSLAEGRYLVTAEIGNSFHEPLILGKEEVEILSRQRSNVVLRLTAAPERISVPLKGILIMPLAWELDEFFLRVGLLDTPLGHTPKRRFFQSNNLSRMEGREDVYRWNAGKVQPGNYKIWVEPPNYVTTIEVGSEGDTNAVINVPPPALVSVRVVEAATGKDADVDDISWHVKMPSKVTSCSLETVIKNPRTDLFDFKAPTGEIVVHVLSAEYNIPDHGGTPVSVVPGSNFHTLEVERSFGFILVLKDGDKIVPYDWEWDITLTLLADDNFVGVQCEGPHPEGRRFTSSVPGLYLFKMPHIPGYKQVGDQKVEVKAGEFVRHEIQLERIQ